MSHLHSHGVPREGCRGAVVHVPQPQWNLGRWPSSYQSHKMPGSYKQDKVLPCLPPRLRDQGQQPGHLLFRAWEETSPLHTQCRLSA